MPDMAAHILNILLDNAFLPAGGNIAEIWIKQVMCGHGKEARVHHASIAFGNLIHGGLHVIVNTAFRDADKSCKCAGMRIKQHLLAL